MTSVEDLRCHGNNLTGSISSDINNLQDLTFFSAHDNSISGTVPGAIGSLFHLSEYDWCTILIIQSTPIDTNRGINSCRTSLSEQE